MNTPHPADTTFAAAYARSAQAALASLQDIFVGEAPSGQEAAVAVKVTDILAKAQSSAQYARAKADRVSADAEAEPLLSVSRLAIAALARENARAAEEAAEQARVIAGKILQVLSF